MGRFALPRIAVSAHATDIQLKDAARNEIAGKVAAFLRKNTIQAAPASTKSREVKPTFNTAISVTPSRQTAVATDKEEIALAIRKYADIEIDGVRIRRSAAEVSVLLHGLGYRLQAASTRRVAESMGIQLSR